MGLFGGSNPYEDAEKAYAPYGDFLKPYGQWGGKDFGAASQYMQGAAADPTGLINHILANYHESPYAQHLTQQAQKSANAAAAAGGYIGTPQEQEAVAQRTGQIADQDQERYLQDALGQFRFGAGGLGGLANQAADHMGQYYGNLAGLAAGASNYANQRGANIFGDIAGLAGAIAPFF